MFSEHIIITCDDCGKDLSDLPNAPNESIPCPDCRSLKRTISVNLKKKIHLIQSSVSLKVKDSTGFMSQKMSIRQSHSDKTGLPVTITKEVNRTDPDQTTFHHKIDELDEHGIISKTIHDHTNPNPARHRSSKKD